MSIHRNPKDFVTFANLLPKIIYEKRWQKKIDQSRVFQIWDSLAGPEIAAQAQPTVIHGRILWLGVSSSVWMQHINFQKYDLLQRINSQLQPEYLEDIRFRLVERISAPNLAPSPSIKSEPDPEKRKEFENLLGAISNQAAQQALHKLWLAFASHEKKI